MLLPLLLALQVQIPGQQNDATLYLRVADEYRSGQREKALIEIRRWQRGEIAASIQALREQADKWLARIGETKGVLGVPLLFNWGTVEAAALMHVEAGLLELQSLAVARAGPHFTGAARLVEWSHELRRQHLRLQQTLAALESETGRPRPIMLARPIDLKLDKRTFYVALAATTLALGFPESAVPYTEKAKESAPSDAEVLLFSACAKEGLALREKARTREANARRLRAEAEALFREVLAVEPAQADALLRLGGVLVAESRAPEAEPFLRQAVERAPDAQQRYVALMLLGRGAELQSNADDAIASYRRALEAWPESQAARLALARGLEASAGPSAARPLVVASLLDSRKPARAPDPLWSYPFGPRGLAKAVMERLWHAVLGRSFGS